MLVDKGMNINCKNNEGDTPLLIATKRGIKENIRLIQKLLELKCNTEIINNSNECFYSLVHKESLNFDCDSVFILIQVRKRRS
jgi:ankyrin repeat protein